MKKIACLLLIGPFILTGCSKEVSPTEAEDIANGIKEYNIDPNSISELKVKYKESSHNNGTTNRELIDKKKDMTRIYELSTRFNYIHTSYSYSNKDKVGNSSLSEERESWFYMKKKVLYKVVRFKTQGNERKTYSKVENYSKAIKEFSKLFDENMAKAYTNAEGKQFLDTDNFVNILGDDYVEGMYYLVKFYSSGAGNLKIAGAAKLDEQKENNITRKGVGTLSAKWNHYILKKAALAFTIKSTDGTSKNDMKINVSYSESVSSLVIPSYPNLSNYAENPS